MKTFLQYKKVLIVLSVFFSFFTVNTVHAVSSVSGKSLEYLEFRDIDAGTYNEYRYRMTEKYFELREGFDVDRVMNKGILVELSELAKTGYRYLPDNLSNKNLQSQLQTTIKQALNNESSDSTFNQLVAALQNYIEDVDIYRMTGNIEVTPTEGNAPLNTTLRANIIDPTGVDIPTYNYAWWIETGEGVKILGRNSYLNYTFTEEGNYAIFLGVKSNHKNSLGNSDVLPYFAKANIRVNEKVASVIMKVNSQSLNNSDELKFDGNEAKFGLLFDATSSTPNSGMKFIETSWDFGNGVKRTNSGGPKVEKVSYTSNGTFNVTLNIKTNTGKIVTRKFTLYINHPAASISVNKNEGYIGDKFTFSSTNRSRDDDAINYSWEIIDINNDEVIHTKNSNLFNYIFTKKGRYNVKLKITLPDGSEDTDTKIIYINSRPPSANFSTKIPFPNRPNYVLLDGSKSYDPDISDEGKLVYEWTIDGKRVNLIDANENGSLGYYRFDSIGQHSIGLQVTDPDNMPDVHSGTVEIRSLLDVDFTSSPTAIQREGTINFTGASQTARFYEWDFGDGKKDYGSNRNISHTYETSGSFVVTLTVTDEQNNRNSVKKNVFVGKSDTPVAVFSMSTQNSESLDFDSSACGGQGAYITSKIDIIKFDGTRAINLDGSNSDLTYSWKIGLNKYDTSINPTFKFDELGCFPVKLTVVSGTNKRSDSVEELIEVRNILPQLSSLTIDSSNEEADPIIFNIRAIGAKDPDGIIQSYLWYYYTDYDSEAQGFKTTPVPETSFVLPKITGTYYFGVVLTDNNEQTFSSEEIGNFFRTVSSDQSDTPIIDLKVNDNSVSINEEVVFTAKVRNIINKDLSNSVEYYWDFDGDGFFEQKGTSPTITYKYQKSGTFFPKLKVKYRGLSNVRNLTVDVNNKLKADFDYLSVGQKFIFLNTSEGKADSVTWDFGDGNTSNIDGDVVHTYSGADRVRTVKLTIREGGKEEVVEKEVVANIKNIIKARKSGVNLFSSPIIEDDMMNVSAENEKITLYPGEANGGDTEVKYYAIDYDTEIDSDLNGGKDDDRDNINTPSYTNGTPLTLPLNRNKNQKVRIFTLDESEEIINSYEFTIDKSYIKEEEIDLDSITFEGVSESEKEKIEELKSLLTDLPTEKRLPAMKYVQRLQEDWHDPRAKTDTMVEMQLFLAQIPGYDPTEVNELLESFLVNDTVDKGEKDVAYNALQNLVPQNVECDNAGEFSSCKEMLTAKLEAIKNSTDLDENKRLGGEILDIIGAQSDKVITNNEKLRFKEVLSPFVYGGVTNVPDDELPELTDNNEDDESKTSKGLGILKWILYITAGVLGLILFGLLLFFIFYKMRNKDKNVEFQDFIIEKTSGKSSAKNDETNDILGESFESQDDELANLDFTSSGSKPETKQAEEKGSNIKLASSDAKKTEKGDELTDPLAGVEVKNDSQKEKQETIPSWLGSTKKKDTQEKVESQTQKKKIDFSEDITDPLAGVKTDFSDTASKEEKIPSWLSGGKTEVKKSENLNKKDEKPSIKEETKKGEDYKKSEAKTGEKAGVKKDDVSSKNPDSDFLEPKLTSASEPEKSVGVPDWLAGVNLDTKKDTVKDTGKKNEEETQKAPGEKAKTQDMKKGEQKTNKNSKKVDSQKSEQKADTSNEEGIPSWLKGSISEKKSEETKGTDEKTREENNKKEIHKNYQASAGENKRSVISNEKKDNTQEKTGSVKNDDSGKNKEEKDTKPHTQKLVKDSDLDNFTKLDDGIPDWLKGSLDSKKKDDTVSDAKKTQADKKTETSEKSEKKASQASTQEKKTSINKEDTLKKEEKIPEQKNKQKSPVNKSTDTAEKKSGSPVKKNTSDQTKTYSKLKADANVSEGTDKFGEGALWEDGMEIPDWLKGGDDTK